jgi:hypothetical protein
MGDLEREVQRRNELKEQDIQARAAIHKGWQQTVTAVAFFAAVVGIVALLVLA